MMFISLVRAAARITTAEAAVLDVDGDPALRTVFGLSSAAADDVTAVLRGGDAVPDGFEHVATMDVPLADTTRLGRLYLLSGQPLVRDAFTSRALALLTEEIAFGVDRVNGGERGAVRERLGHRVRELAGNIESQLDPAAILELPRAGNVPTFCYVNAAFERFFGISAAEISGASSDVLQGPLTDRGRIEFLRDRIAAGREGRTVIVYYKRTGVPVWVDVAARPLVEPNGAVSLVVVTVRDVTARREFEAAIGSEKRKLQVTLAAIGDAVITTVADGRVEFINAAARDMLQIDPVDAYGECVDHVVRLVDDRGVRLNFLNAGIGEAVQRGRAHIGRGRHLKHIEYVCSPIGDDGFVIVLRDVTAQHRLAKQLSYDASHDALTGLFNRRKFQAELEAAVAAAQHGDDAHSVAFLDLDRFKAVNDACGHAVGDRVLVDIAHILKRHVRGRDTLARLGGDEFAILLKHCSIANARRVLDKLRLAVDAYRITHDGRTFAVGISIGLAAIDATTGDAAAALAVADAACYAAKSAGRNLVVG